jgi:hypothetical protein
VHVEGQRPGGLEDHVADGSADREQDAEERERECGCVECECGSGWSVLCGKLHSESAGCADCK